MLEESTSVYGVGYVKPLSPSVPRFSARFVTSETGGGYRRYSQLCQI
jgi:hypothetical protein